MSKPEIRATALLDDGITPAVRRMTGNVNSELTRSTAVVRRNMSAQEQYLNKVSSKFAKFGMGLIGFGVILKSFSELKKGLVDIGVETEGINDSLSSIRNTVANQLRKEVEGLFQLIESNTEVIARNLAMTLNLIMAPFRIAAGSLQDLYSKYLILKSAFQLAGSDQWKATLELAKQNQKESDKSFDEILASLKFENIVVLPPTKKPTEKTNKSGAAGKVKDDSAELVAAAKAADDAIEGYNKKINDETKRAVEVNAQLYLNEWEQKKTAIYLQFDEEINAIKGNDQLKIDLAKLRDKQLAEIDEERTRKDKEESDKRIQQEKIEARQRKDIAVNMGGLLVRTMETVGEASRANANEMKRIRIAGVWMDAAAAEIAAMRSVWDQKGSNYYIQIAESIATSALITAQAVAASTLISRQQFASGGYARAGMALVGEHGPEYVAMRGGERVYNSQRSRAMEGSGSGMVVNLTLPNNQPVDLAAADRIEQSAREIGSVLLRADYLGLLRPAKSALRA